jgi:hypothetical protein
MLHGKILLASAALGWVDMEIYKKLQHLPEAPMWVTLIAVSTIVLIASVFKITSIE